MAKEGNVKQSFIVTIVVFVLLMASAFASAHLKPVPDQYGESYPYDYHFRVYEEIRPLLLRVVEERVMPSACVDGATAAASMSW